MQDFVVPNVGIGFEDGRCYSEFIVLHTINISISSSISVG